MNDQPALADLDLDAWIDGATNITQVAKIVQRGDLLAKRTRLEEELKLARKLAPDDRGLDDRTPEVVRAELDQVERDIYNSMLVVTIQDRTEDYRKKLRKKLIEDLELDPVNNSDDLDILSLHIVADAIVKAETADGRQIAIGTDGFGGQRLAKIQDQCGNAATIELFTRYREMTSTSPAVQAPLSHGSSSTRGGATSRSKSAPRARGASPRG